MPYLDFDLKISPGPDREYPLAARSPAGDARATLSFPFDALTLENRLKDLHIALLQTTTVRRKALTTEEQAVQDFGQRLFEALFTGEVRRLFDVSRAKAAQEQWEGVRLRLQIQAPELAVLPWEYLYDPRQGDYVCLSRQTPLVRSIALPQPVTPLKVALPLRILGMVTIPNDQEALEVQRERERMQAALTRLEALGLVRLTWVQGQTWHDLQRAMWGGPWHIFHFIGHGGFDPNSEEGVLALAGESGQTHLLRATDVGRLLASHADLRLVVLNACEGAKGGTQDIFSSTAATLARKGIPAVLAMQEDITDRAAIEWTRALYEALAHGLPIDAAVAETRTSMSVGITRTLEWGTPVLYLQAPEGVLFEMPPTLSGVSYRERVISPAANQQQPAHTSATLSSPTPARSPTTPEKMAPSSNVSLGHPTDVSITPQAAMIASSAQHRGMTRRTLIGTAASMLVLVGSGATVLFLTQNKPFQQQITTGIHITMIQVGTGFDATAGVVTGEKSIFHRGERIYIVFTVVTQEVQAQVVVKLFHQGALEATSQPLTPQVGSHPYTNPVEVSQTGTYQVEINYAGTREATITFNVTT